MVEGLPPALRKQPQQCWGGCCISEEVQPHTLVVPQPQAAPRGKFSLSAMRHGGPGQVATPHRAPKPPRGCGGRGEEDGRRLGSCGRLQGNHFPWEVGKVENGWKMGDPRRVLCVCVVTLARTPAVRRVTAVGVTV